MTPSSWPTVSVLMPAYNAGRYLSEAIESLLIEDYEAFELIVVDDGSTDETPQILEGCDDARLVRLRHKENLGYAHALNRALSLARGRYIARQDADDLSAPGRLRARRCALAAGERSPGTHFHHRLP